MNGSLRSKVEHSLIEDRARRDNMATVLDGESRLQHFPSPLELDAAHRADPFCDRKGLLLPNDALLALLLSVSDALVLHQENGLPAADDVYAWRAIVRRDLPRPLCRALATTVAERSLERCCAAAFSDGSEEDQGRWFRAPWRAAEQAAAVCARSDAVGFANGVVAWHLLARVLPRRALVVQGAVFLVHEAEVAYDSLVAAQRKRRLQAALLAARDQREADALRRDIASAEEAAAPLPRRAAKGGQLFLSALAVHAVMPAALALVTPLWGCYVGELLVSAVSSSLPLDFIATALLSFAGQ